ncbi:MAG: hypothetical protein ACLFQ5_11565 [Oceanicaulis sp.]
MKFIADLFKPILTILVTVFAGALIVSIVWPAADEAIQSQVPAWERLDPVIEQARAWLGIHQPEDDAPWWRFWN